MKIHTYIFAICVVSALAFFGCAKKSATQSESIDSQNEIISAVQSETVSAQTKNSELSKEVVFSEEDNFIIKEMKRYIRMLSANDLVEANPMGTYKLYYGDTERVWAPVTSITDTDLKVNGEAAYARFSSCLNAKRSNALGCFSSMSGVTLIALETEDTGDNILTLLFSNDHAKTWNTAYVEIDGEYLGETKRPKYYLFCTDSTTGYLLLGGMEKIEADGSYSWEKIPGAHIFRTQDAGVSWEEIGGISDTVDHYLFVRGNTIFLGGRKDRYPCLFKSNDYTNWEEIELPVDKERYSSGSSNGFHFEGDYGIVDAYMYLREKGERNHELISFATKDGGETWGVWEVK